MDTMDEQQTATNSAVRSRIVQESIAANKQRRYSAQRSRKYTKRHRYDGFQSVLDSRQMMVKLKQHRKPPDAPTFSISSTECNDDDDDNDLTPVIVGAAMYGEGQGCYTFDPVLREINEMQEICQTASSKSTSSSWKDPPLFSQPASQPITHEQLIQEVKGIYEDLAFVEAKCLETAQEQTLASRNLTETHTRALMATHRSLLLEYHDFFAATQHPAATAMLRSLAQRHRMPERMWRHAMHSCLQLLLHCGGPSLIGQMTSFIHFARPVLKQLAEDVPSMIDDWIEVGRALDSYAELLNRDIEHPERYAPDLHGCSPLQSNWQPCYHQKSPLASDDSSSSLRSSFSPWVASENPYAKPEMANDISIGQIPEQLERNECRSNIAASNTNLSDIRDHSQTDVFPCPNIRFLEREIQHTHVTDNCDRFTDGLHLPEHVNLTINTWLNYGQAICAERIDIFAKVFLFLSMVGKHGRGWWNQDFEATVWSIMAQLVLVNLSYYLWCLFNMKGETCYR